MSEALNPSEAAPAPAPATNPPAPPTTASTTPTPTPTAPTTLLGGGLDQKSPWGELPEDVYQVVERFKTPEALANGYFELQQLASKKANVAQPPTNPTTPEEWKATLTLLGLPPTAEGYDLQGVGAKHGVSEADLKGFADLAFKAGLLPHQAQGLTQAMQASTKASEAASKQLEMQERQAGEEALRQDWGAQYQQKLGVAQRALEHVNQKTGAAPGELHALLEERGLGDHPALVRAFATIGEMLAQGAGQVHGVAGSGGGFLLDTPEAAQRKLSALQQDPAFMQRLNAGEEAAVAQNKALHEASYNRR